MNDPASLVAPSDAPAFDLASATGRVGTYAWISSRLFEVTGSWAAGSDDDRTTAELTGLSSRFAWQAGQWVDRLPVLREAPRDELVRAPGPEATALFADLEALEPIGLRLAALAAVIGRFDVVLAAHDAVRNEVRDRSLGFTLQLIRGELAAIGTTLDEIGNFAVTSDTSTVADPAVILRWRTRLDRSDALLA